MLQVEVNYGALRGGTRLPMRVIETVLREVARATRARGIVSLAFVSPREIRRLNRLHRGKDRMTDVLSFNIGEAGLLGEVVICYSQAKRQAQEMGHPTRHEMVFLLVHGIMHLLGHDHARVTQRKRMFALQSRILGRLGIDPRI